MAKIDPVEDKLRKAIIQGYERLLRKTQCTYPYVTMEEVKRVREAIGDPPDMSWHLDHVFPLDAWTQRHKTSPLTAEEVALLNSPHNLRWAAPSENLSKQHKHDNEAFHRWLMEHTKATS